MDTLQYQFECQSVADDQRRSFAEMQNEQRQFNAALNFGISVQMWQMEFLIYQSLFATSAPLPEFQCKD